MHEERSGESVKQPEKKKVGPNRTKKGMPRKRRAPSNREDAHEPPTIVPNAKQLDVAEIGNSAVGVTTVAVAAGAKEKTKRSARKRQSKFPRKHSTDRHKPVATEAGDESKPVEEVKRGHDGPSDSVSPRSEAEPGPPPRSRGKRGGRKAKRRRAVPRDEEVRSRDEPAPASDSPAAEAKKEEARPDRPPAGGASARERTPPKKAGAKSSRKTGAQEARSAKRDEPESFEPSTTGKGRAMVINVSAGDECRIAVLVDGRLEELFLERSSAQSHVGNIYKGRVTNVEASIQAVFVDFGLPKNGFLHISDVQPQYFPHHTGETEEVGRKIPRHSRPPIQKCFRRGQEVIVQVTKEGVGTKGPTLTTYLSIPGRFLVMMPGMGKHGVSRKIEDDAERRAMRDMLNQLKLPTDMGFIMRTAGSGRTKRDLQRDLNYLLRLWKTVVTRIKRLGAPAELYQESDLVTRTIRDVYTTDFRRLVVDDAETAKKVREFLQLAMPRSRHEVEIYTEREPLFHRLGIEDEIDRINMRQVPLPSGGSIVIDSTEAMVAIDVNSGKFRSPENAEETAFLINTEAAEEIARQLRLRDLGGLIVCDFIDMRDDRHKRAIERTMRDALKKHKERARILRMSAFGLIEITRQRQGPSLSRNMYDDCPHCRGSGQVKLPESVRLDVIRLVQLAVHQESVARVIVTVSSPVAFEILNQKRAHLSQIEDETGKTIVIRGEDGFAIDRVECVCEDQLGRPVSLGREGSASSNVPGRSAGR